MTIAPPIRPRVGLVACAAACAALGAARCAAAPAARPSVQLVETVPVETQLGNPALPAAQAVWIEMIRGAKRRLDLEEFYLSHWPGEPLQDVLDAIGEAASRGVKVRLILDARMHETYPEPADSLGRVAGIQVRLLDMGAFAGGIQHAKFFLVDDREVFLGSQNLDWRALKHIHELGVRVRDPRVNAEFREVFEMDWAASRPGPRGSAVGVVGAARRQATGARRRPGRGPSLPVPIVQTAGDTVKLWPSYSPRGFIPDSTLWDRDGIVRLLDSARGEIVLQLLSYTSADRDQRDDALDLALRRAAGRGVRVRLLISDWQADGPRIGELQSLSQVPNVEAKLSTVPEWSGGYIPFARVEHCKYVVVDSLWTWVGTSNWGPSYFHSSRNVAVTMRNRPLALQARRVFEASWAASGAVPVRADSQYPPRVHGMEPPPGRPVYGR